ncbi:MAG: putative molybdenum carrier protein [Deltaproteobacteria bacterium]|jgi:predicted Rossmann fold nucleotide-binding protein DprA/Smf involved in DNA uptake|nr:putative molybdenum carrier protein [Deltaproteobacteria bacterium]
MLCKIVSGGQTGADRAALETALELDLECGGWVPLGRRAEDGAIPDRYPGLVETSSRSYARRTRLNVRDSDATLILGFGPLGGGSALTREIATELGRPLLVLDLEQLAPAEAERMLRDWLAEVAPRVLNVAGPRASGEPRIYDATRALLRSALGARTV